MIADLFGRSRKIPEDRRRFMKTTKVLQRLPKMSEDYRSFPRRTVSENVRLYFPCNIDMPFISKGRIFTV